MLANIILSLALSMTMQVHNAELITYEDNSAAWEADLGNMPIMSKEKINDGFVLRLHDTLIYPDHTMRFMKLIYKR